MHKNSAQGLLKAKRSLLLKKVYNHKELNLCNHLNELKSAVISRPSRKEDSSANTLILALWDFQQCCGTLSYAVTYSSDL